MKKTHKSKKIVKFDLDLCLSSESSLSGVWNNRWNSRWRSSSRDADGRDWVRQSMKNSVVGDHSVGFDDSSAVDGDSGLMSSLQEKRGVRVVLDSVNCKVDS